MDKKTLKSEILKLLKTSTVSEHHKKMMRILLPVMKISVLQRIYDSLLKEQEKMRGYDQKIERIEMKYKVMVEKLSEMELRK